MCMPSGPIEASTCGTSICDGSSHGYADTQSVELFPSTTRQEWVVTVAKYPSFWSYFEENRELSSQVLVIQETQKCFLYTRNRRYKIQDTEKCPLWVTTQEGIP